MRVQLEEVREADQPDRADEGDEHAGDLRAQWFHVEEQQPENQREERGQRVEHAAQRAGDLRLRQREEEGGDRISGETHEEQRHGVTPQQRQVAQRDGQQHDHRDAHAIGRDLGGVEPDQPLLDQDEGAAPDQGEQGQDGVLHESGSEVHPPDAVGFSPPLQQAEPV
jgi:hypothetical protein